MNEHTTALIQQQPSSGSDEHQTVIKFVLSGPILAGQPEVAHATTPPAEEIAELRERLSVLERALAEADSRFEAMQQALAATVAAAAANAVGAASASARSTPPPPPAVEVAPEPPVAAEPGPELPPVHDFMPAATFDPPVEPAPITPFAPPAAGPISYFTPPPVEPSSLAMAVMPDPLELSLVTEPAAPAPALRSPDPGPPKIRGLRRMISVLKNL